MDNFEIGHKTCYNIYFFWGGESMTINVTVNTYFHCKIFQCKLINFQDIFLLHLHGSFLAIFILTVSLLVHFDLKIRNRNIIFSACGKYSLLKVF